MVRRRNLPVSQRLIPGPTRTHLQKRARRRRPPTQPTIDAGPAPRRAHWQPPARARRPGVERRRSRRHLTGRAAARPRPGGAASPRTSIGCIMASADRPGRRRLRSPGPGPVPGPPAAGLPPATWLLQVPGSADDARAARASGPQARRRRRHASVSDGRLRPSRRTTVTTPGPTPEPTMQVGCYPCPSVFSVSLCRPSPVATPAPPSSLPLSADHHPLLPPPLPLLSLSLPSITRCSGYPSHFSLSAIHHPFLPPPFPLLSLSLDAQ